MREAAVRRRTALTAWPILLLLLPAPLGAGSAPPDAWTVVVRDEAMDATFAGPVSPVAPDARLDVLTLEMADDPSWLWLKLTTRASPLGAGSPQVPDAWDSAPTSHVEFTIVPQETRVPHLVRIVAEEDLAVVTTDGIERARVPLNASEGQLPWGYTIALSRWQLLPEAPLRSGDDVSEPLVMMEQTGAPLGSASDRAPSSGFGEEYELVASSGEGDLPAWRETEGVEFVAGPSLAIGSDGSAHVAYIVYNDERDTRVGLYHAVFRDDGAVAVPAERVADAAMPTNLHESDHTQTAIAVDDAGRAHIVYSPSPNADAQEIRYATRGTATWIVEDPAALADGRRLAVDDSYRGVPSVVVREGRVVVAFQSGQDVAVVERTPNAGWRLLQVISDARFPRLALDTDGRAHVAWLGGSHRREGDTDEKTIEVATLRYASEAASWRPSDVATEVVDFSPFWETSESDGGFAFALGPDDRAHFVWQPQRGDPQFGILHGDALKAEPAPLVPSHGNPQTRMRMAIDTDGRAHMISGYGGTDHYAVRSPEGLWLRENLDRFVIAQLALTPDGRAVIAYTQPHGGATLGVSTQTAKAESPAADTVNTASELGMGPVSLPRAAPLIAAAAAVAGGAGGLLTWFGFRSAARRPVRWRWLALVGGFSRIARPNVADHAARDGILQAVQSSPGIESAELRHRLGLPRSTFFYHVRRLERERMLVVRQTGARLTLALPGAVVAHEQLLPPAIQDLVAAVRASPGVTTDAVASQLRLPRRTTAHRLARLERDGFVARVEDGARPARWRAT